MKTLAPKNVDSSIIFISMLYLALEFTSLMLVYKVIPLGNHLFSIASPITALWFILNDMITEVYGYELVRKLFWSLGAVEGVFCVFFSLIAYLPSPDASPLQTAYLLILGRTFITYFAGFGLLIGTYINTCLISKWKILVRGKYFWLRSVTSSSIGTIIFLLLAGPIIFFDTPLQGQLFWIMFFSFSLKILLIILLAFPATLITTYLKNKEGLDVFDRGIDYNPFNILNSRGKQNENRH